MWGKPYIRRNYIPKNVDTALYVSDGWHRSYLEYSEDGRNEIKQFALHCRVKSLITYDRILNGYKANGQGKLNTSWAGEFNGK